MKQIERKYREWKPGKWAQTLHEEYFNQMSALVDEVTASWFSEKDIAEGYADYVKARYVFGRMEIAQTRLLPFILESIPDLRTKRVLEIGCGNGSATVPLAKNSAYVNAFDLAAEQVEIAGHRCRLMGAENVKLFARNADWIDSYVVDWRSVCSEVDVIVCYALFEHLLPMERLKLLIGAWEHLPVGGHLIVIETPNRLYWFDWHSSQIPFCDQLPAELLFFWNSASPRGSIPATIKGRQLDDIKKFDLDRMYRFGRGASFHEFYVALGPENFTVVSETIMDRKELIGFDLDAIAGLERLLDKVNPAPHRAFAQPSLDIVVQKTGPSRMKRP